jgi:methylmalonyl-CoA mutase
MPAARLSTAFDSVTLYGRDPAPRPDIFGKVGNSGVSVCTVEDAVKLYSGFDLAAPSTSVSMTINGPAPTVLAFYLNAAIDQGVERHLRETAGSTPCGRSFHARSAPLCGCRCPRATTGSGSHCSACRATRWSMPRPTRGSGPTCCAGPGTVQADILKEDQAQNTCIFSTDFSLQVMGDVQQYFIENEIENFYSVSISGYHIAEAGANPISQLAFTLANGFTYCEYYRARGMAVDDFAPNFSFFFSNGLDAEYSVIGASRAGSGRSRCASATARASAARSSSITSKPRVGRCTRRRWRSTTSAPRCRRSPRSRTSATACTRTPTTRR